MPDDTPKDLEFTCPSCKRHRLEEVMVGVTVASNVVVSEGGNVEYYEQSNEDGTVERYQCMYCGFVIKNDDDQEIVDCLELAEWLKAHA